MLCDCLIKYVGKFYYFHFYNKQPLNFQSNTENLFNKFVVVEIRILNIMKIGKLLMCFSNDILLLLMLLDN